MEATRDAYTVWFTYPNGDHFTEACCLTDAEECSLEVWLEYLLEEDHITDWSVSPASEPCAFDALRSSIRSALNLTDFYCTGCGREESECSLDPCAGVISDRGGVA